MPLTATSTHCGSGRKGAGKFKFKLKFNDSAPESMAAGSGVDYDGPVVVIQTAMRAFLARKEAAALKEARKEALKEAAFPPSPEYTLAELLDAAFPDLEEMFSAEELLALWGEFEADKM